MELIDCIRKRRSVRSYSEKRIELNRVKEIITAATLAPSACDIQGWRFIVINDKEVLNSLIEKDTAVFVKKAPLSILVIYDNRTENIEYYDHIQSASAAIQNMILRATSLGIGSCWVCHLPRKEEIRKMFGIPRHYDPIALVAFGYCVKTPPLMPRKHRLEELISYNNFRFKEDAKKSMLKLRLKRLARKVYYLTPFRRLIRKQVNDLFEKRFDSKEVYKEEPETKKI